MRKLLLLVFVTFAVLLSSMEVLAEQGQNKKQYRKTELVELIKLEPSIMLDIRYATKNSFLGRPVYMQARAFLQKPVAEDLIRVHKKLSKQALGLLVFDGYRPWSITKLFWDEIEPDKRKFVADPRVGSIHNRGCAVDLTLYDLKTGKAIKMPSEYDEFSEKAYPSYNGGTKEERDRRDFLISVMKQGSFTVHLNEWWHFNHKDCEFYQVLDIPFEKITSESLSSSDKLERH